MSENTKTDKTATVQSSSNKSATPLIVPPSEIKVVAPKMVSLKRADDSTSGTRTLGGITSRNSDNEK
jgi:hypothetical protein